MQIIQSRLERFEADRDTVATELDHKRTIERPVAEAQDRERDAEYRRLRDTLSAPLRPDEAQAALVDSWLAEQRPVLGAAERVQRDIAALEHRLKHLDDAIDQLRRALAPRDAGMVATRHTPPPRARNDVMDGVELVPRAR